MSRLRVGIVGASGYSGAVAARLVASHPSLDLAFVTSDKLAGTPARKHLGAPVNRDIAFVPNASALEASQGADVVLLATPAEASADLTPKLLAAHDKLAIIDLSGAFRLGSATDYRDHYGFSHPCPELLHAAFYGLPELFGPPPRGARLISNPGCYPTATLLAIAPLVREGLVEPHGIVIDAKSGVSGAGVQAKQEYSFVEIDEDVRAYKLLAHQHTPEIARHLDRANRLRSPGISSEPLDLSRTPSILASADPPTLVSDVPTLASSEDRSAPPRITFTPHLVPVKRGLLSTCYARPRAGTTAARVHECLADLYTSSAFVDVVAPAEVTMKSVVGTNRARVGATANEDVVVAIGVIDNLLKGAAGQALQNLNLLFGLGETAGLEALHPVSP